MNRIQCKVGVSIKFFFILIVSVLVLSSLTSCKKRLAIFGGDSAEEESVEENVVEEDSREEGEPYRFEDLPVPLGFTLDRSQSFIYETAFIRAGKLTYNGSETMLDLVNFYKGEMPGHGWVLSNIFEDENVMLNFTKEGVVCAIRISKGTWRAKKVEIKIGPTG